MKRVRTLVVDDEPDARGHLVELLSADARIDVIGEARNGEEAIGEVLKGRPDLLFLDVRMPGMDGFQVMERLARLGDRVPLPFVVFVTAHDGYALKAFDVNAVDYLLKPYEDDRFHASLEKVKYFIGMRQSTRLTGKLMDLVREHIRADGEFTEQFTIKDRGLEHVVCVDELLYLRAEGNYLYLRSKDRHFLYRMTMNAVESELDPARFLRIHRRYIVNRSHVRSTRYGGNNEFIFNMANGERIVSGRIYKEKIAEVLQEQVV